MCGHYNEHTGNHTDGNYYCQQCGNQVPAGFKHHHAKDVPHLKRQVAKLEATLTKHEIPIPV